MARRISPHGGGEPVGGRASLSDQRPRAGRSPPLGDLQFRDCRRPASSVDGAAGLDLNYGAAKDLQLTATLPIAFQHSAASEWHGGSGDVELGAKYRFIHNEMNGWQAAVFPRVILPTAGGHLGGSRARLLLPQWLQKDCGKTSIFGGGGYEINPGTGNKNFWQAGLAATRDLSERLPVGGEVVWQFADVRGGHGSRRIDLGLIRKLHGPFALLFAGGPSFSAGQTSYHAYLALSLNY